MTGTWLSGWTLVLLPAPLAIGVLMKLLLDLLGGPYRWVGSAAALICLALWAVAFVVSLVVAAKDAAADVRAVSDDVPKSPDRPTSL